MLYISLFVTAKNAKDAAQAHAPQCEAFADIDIDNLNTIILFYLHRLCGTKECAFVNASCILLVVHPLHLVQYFMRYQLLLLLLLLLLLFAYMCKVHSQSHHHKLHERLQRASIEQLTQTATAVLRQTLIR